MQEYYIHTYTLSFQHLYVSYYHHRAMQDNRLLFGFPHVNHFCGERNSDWLRDINYNVGFSFVQTVFQFKYPTMRNYFVQIEIEGESFLLMTIVMIFVDVNRTSILILFD